MKKIICYLIFFVGPLFSQISFAQYDLEIQFNSRQNIQASSNQSTFFWVRNIGPDPSPDFSVRMWASVDNDFTGGDDVEMERSYTSLTTYMFDPDRGFSLPSESPSISFSMPLPEDQNANMQRSDILGEQYYFRACIFVAGVMEDCVLSQTREVVPPAVNNVRIVDDTDGKLTLNWQEVPWDIYLDNNDVEQRVNMVSWYVIRQYDPSGVLTDNVATLTPDEISVAEGDVGTRVFQRIFTAADGLDIGKRYSYSVHSCHQLTPLGCYDQRPSFPGGGISSRRAVGAIEADFQASMAAFDDRVEVSWESPTTNPNSTPRYEIIRCEEGNPESCIGPFEPEGNATIYNDFDVVRGKRYVYTIDACDEVITYQSPRRGKCSLGRIDKYKIGVTNAGFRGLVDEYEEDDTAAQATRISGDVLQLHSFDSSTDEDWVKLTLRKSTRVLIETKPFEGNNVDTELSLYDANLALLDLNIDRDRESPGSFSRIESERLAPGDYFIKATHFKLVPDGQTEPIIPAPLADNYYLAIELLDTNVNMTPILMLLMEE